MENTDAVVQNNSHVSDCHRPTQASSCSQQLPLSMVHAGERVQVKCVCGKDETRRFLSNLGFVENAEIAVITEMNGNVIVNIKGTRLAISKVMARRVMTF